MNVMVSFMLGRRSYTRAAQLQYVAGPGTRHEAGNAGEAIIACGRFALSVVRQRIAREAGSCVRGLRRCGVCAWLLLAYAPVSVGQAGPRDQQGVLGRE